MIKRRHEKKIKERLQSEAEHISPGNWEKLELKIAAVSQEETLQPEPKSRPVKQGRRKLVFRFAAVFCALLILTGAVYFSPLRQSFVIQAKAEALYDSSGHLADAGNVNLSQGFVDGYNGFGLSLLKELASEKKNENLFISPASIYLALGMTYNGANGQTADEFAKVLGNKGNLADFNNDSRSLQAMLLRKDSGFSLANSLWIDGHFKDQISEEFIGRDRDYFGSGVYAPDFKNPGTPALINNWVNKNTGGLLPGSIKGIGPNTVMYLVNTIYFKQPWLEPFDEKDTSTQVFHTPEGDKKIPFISGERSGYYADDEVENILLPYDGEKTSMLILLPQENLNEFISSLTPERVQDILNCCKTTGRNVDVSLMMPKLTLRQDLTLDKSLKSLGLKTAFADADFSGMLKDGLKRLCIGSVTHQTYLKVDEQGTTAAGQTTVEMEQKCATLFPPSMTVDRPYLTAIVDNNTGAILFIGCVTDPG